ncbi:Xaa-Pro aminopeptidase [Idiomarina sp. WRN-38]|uniref:Xaa-Pro aminopeptidase n=1 Tax=Idiomarina sp. OXR-189 TaxID=3100175 RepID=UPI0007339307|nr:Xaa-Pro aminopeptidase [Idiomarina sp. OXR-189]KTG29855.1 Xaa-Pro aminopeptidase [Idiomarina sp. H105]OAF13246.1 Xaa-Pro aminopeptidase [Idiomarina sp. WRN-38]WPZ00848.1 Xaa-Pro aminopeptidase [Idiomarina sp. OXR-189]
MTAVISVEEFAQRRQALMKRMPLGAVAIIAGNSEVTRSNDTEYPFRQNSDFFYLTGFAEPDAVLLLVNGEKPQSLLFCQDKDPQQEVWHGLRLGYENAEQTLKVDAAEDIDAIEERLPDILKGMDSVFYLMGDQAEVGELINGARNQLQLAARRSGELPPQSLRDLRALLDDMRLIKSEAEINVMRESARISSNAFRRIMRFVEPGKHEYQVGAELHHEFAMNGALYPAYGMICGGGANACVLHYTDNKDVLNDGDLILVDAGAEYQGYAADITRTFPVNGKFSDTQRTLYEMVLKAQQAAFEEIKPGSNLVNASNAAARVINDGLVELGIIDGDPDTAFEAMRWKTYFIHGLGHWLGLDVHDMGRYKDDNGKPVSFEPGMVLTVEPGIYIPEDADVDEKWRGIGIRIEDDLVVTAEGYENLSSDVPKTIEEIEAWMSGK